MKKTEILTSTQKQLLDILRAQPTFFDTFYLTGGTALNAFYLPYRFSEDLDFFSEQTIDTQSLISFIKTAKPKLGFKTYQFTASFNRNLFMLNFPHELLKIEFTYFPFPPIYPPQKHDHLKVDSLFDIAVNKLFTIYQKPRSRDFIDLFLIQKKYRFTIAKLIAMARNKFETSLDLLQLGAHFMQASEVKDYPRLIKPLSPSLWQNYFLAKAKKFKKAIIA